MIPKKFKEINITILLGGPGSGSKLFQSFIDDHPEVLMIPGYILMYFYPHWDKHLKNLNSWNKIIVKFLSLHPSILNSGQMKGDDYLYNLGSNKNQKITINKKKYVSFLRKILKDEKINSKNFFIAVHMAYFISLKKNLSNKTNLVYHMHVCWYLERFIKDFNKFKIITMIRDLKSNIPKRIKSLEDPNRRHLNYTDCFFFKTRSYKNIIYEDFFSLDFLQKFKNKNRVVKHEDLLSRKRQVLKNFCKFINIKFNSTLMSSSFNSLLWNYKPERKIKLVGGVAKHISSYDTKKFYNYELFWIEMLNYEFNGYYKYKKLFKKNFLSFLLTIILIFLPSKKEVYVTLNVFKYNSFKNYLKFLKYEVINKKLKKYEKNAFYFHKWSNKYFPFSKINFVIRKIKTSGNSIWHLIYIIIKILEYILIPIFCIVEYLIRIYLCSVIIIKNLFCLRFFPKKL
ncbi:MAG: hypothetical protein CMG02_00080 [Candidatus Marinimicrobia bacterium]|nr:hypothetical protein [Candidatus Neomarinimicrobiota bacterium]